MKMSDKSGPLSTGDLALRALILATTLVVGWLFVDFQLATTFREYDDEGYLLLSLDHYLKGGDLYTTVYSQYGPFFFQVKTIVFGLLQMDVNHDAGRLVTFLFWLLSGSLCGYFILGISANASLASAAALACVYMSTAFANEPGHPQELCLTLVMLASCLSLRGGRRNFSMFLLGAIGSALVFTKINIGVFYFVALAHSLICGLPPGRVRSLGLSFSAAFAISAPMLLMRRDLPGWAAGICAVAVMSGTLTFIAGGLNSPSTTWTIRQIRYVVVGALSAGLLIVVAAMLRGMSLATMMDGVLWAPLRHPNVFQVPLLISAPWILIAGLVTSGAAVLLYCRHQAWAQSDKLDALRCVGGLCLTGSLLWNPAAIGWAVALLPLGLIPPNGRRWQPADFFPRVFIATLASTQYLHLYPVAGSQRSISAAIVLLWAFVCIYDGAPGLVSLTHLALRLRGNAPSAVSVAGAVLTLAVVSLMVSSTIRTWKEFGPPSILPGSASLHLPRAWEDRYLFLSNRIRANCDVLFTLPGMGSLNFWSGVPTPNGSNLTAWMRGFGPERQQTILNILKSSKRACAVYNPALVESWATPVSGLSSVPLAAYVISDMPVVATRDGYEIRVHPQRDSPWVEATPAGFRASEGSR